jgi:outer membrane lipoprotein-sorting protein
LLAGYNETMLRRSPVAILLLCLITMLFSSCLAHHLPFGRAGANPNQKLLTADQAALVEAIARQYNAIHDFNATVDMAPSVGSAEKNQITEYKDVRAYIYFRKPAEVHILGLAPLLRTRAFEMVSDGTEFKLYLPTQNRFIVGKNEVVAPSPNKLANLRPQHFVNAMLVHPIDPKTEKVVMVNFTDENNAFYTLLVLHDDGGKIGLSRSIWFSRVDLQMARQLIFDENGNILTDARYSQWHPYDNVPFPKHIEINRPRDEYGMIIDIVKMDINKGVSDDKLVLAQPEGTTLQVLGEAPVTPPKSEPPPVPRKKK